MKPLENESGVDADGTLRVRDLVIPPSQLWSAEYRAFHAAMLAKLASQPRLPVPDRYAAQSDWDDYNSRVHQQFFAEPLAWVRQHYAADVAETDVAGVRVGIISPRDGVAPENQDRILIHLRGGGFVYNRGLLFGQLEAIPVAALGRIKVMTVDYRQAPQHRYPAATEDVEAIYRTLLNRYRPEAIGIFGSSAGGALAAQSVVWLRNRQLPRPGAIGVLCNALSPTWARRDAPEGDSGIWTVPLRPASKAQRFETDIGDWDPVRWYMEGVSVNDVEAYPHSSDEILASFPPTLFLTGTRDFSMSQTVTSHARLLRLGVDSSLYVMEGGTHAAHILAAQTPEARDACRYVAQWFSRHLS